MQAAVQRKDGTRPVADDRRPRRQGPADSRTLRLVVKTSGGVVLLEIADIECLEAQGNQVVVHARQGEFRIRTPLSSLLDHLSNFGFIRIHRGTVVRADAIAAVEKGAFRKAFAVLRSGARHEIGRADFERLRALWQPGLLDLSELSSQLRIVPAEALRGA